MADKIDIYVYAHWKGMEAPKLTGILYAALIKGKRSFSFEYDKGWLASEHQFVFDPDIQFYRGPQYPNGKENFGIFLDSMPDTWGRTLMRRRAAVQAGIDQERPKTLHEVDFLLGVYDQSRMGALRFKTDPKGLFLDDDPHSPTPPWSSVRELQRAAAHLEDDDNEDVTKWLTILMAPGSSLGGARPKANILDESGHPWIAKFPSKNDTTDKALWEFLAYELARLAGIDMAESRIEKLGDRYHTFFTKRFDRESGDRIHFASAMTMTGHSEDIIRDAPASYLDLVDFIQNNAADIEADLGQLWRRMVFNMAISNTDDHLRNHGFLLDGAGWRLSPAYDINPSIDKDGLALTVDGESSALDFELAKSVGEYFRLSPERMNEIISEIARAVSQWQAVAKRIGIPRAEQQVMAAAFRWQ